MKKSLFIFLFFVAAFYLLPLFFRPLTGPEEFRTAEIAREMLTQEKFLSAKLLGGRYFEVPPLQGWLTAASFKLFGLNLFALRLIPFLGVLGSGLFLFLWCRKRGMSDQSSLKSVFLFLSGTIVIIAGSAAAADALWGFFLTSAMVSFWFALEEKTLKKRCFFSAAGGVFMGWGFLTGGFAALILPPVAAALYLLWQKRLKELLLFPWLPLMAAALLIAPWGTIVHETEPDFWRQFALFGEVRKLTGVSQFPFWLRCALPAAGLLPGVLIVLSAIPRLRQGAAAELHQDPGVRFALCFFAVPFILCALPSGDLRLWLLPCFAPAALLGIMILEKTDGEKALAKLRKTTTVFSFIFILAGSAALLSGVFYLLWGTGFIASLPLKFAVWMPFFTTAALGMVVSGTILFIHRSSKLPEPESFLMLGAITAAVCAGFFPGFTAHCKMPEYEMLEIASQLSEAKIRHPRLLASRELAYAAAWCFKDNTVQIINSPGELEYGHRYAVAYGERPLMLTFEQIEKLVKSPERKEGVLLLVCKNNFNELPAALLTAGKTFSTAGALSALYYPGKEDKTGK